MSAIDIIAVRQRDGSFKMSPLILHLSKKAIDTHEVTVAINGKTLINNSEYKFVVQKGFQYACFIKNGCDAPVLGKNLAIKPQSPVTPLSPCDDLFSPAESPTSFTKDPYATTFKDEDKNWKQKLLDSVESETYNYEHTMPPSVWSEQIRLELEQKEIVDVTFITQEETVSTSLHIWSYTDNLVVSDIDGTITKSDIRGILCNIIGVDYTHDGIVSLFNNIHNKGYRIIYMTARSIDMFNATKQYIERINQNNSGMPAGPIITAPNTIINALCREVIIRRPETFKIAMLQCITSLFADHNPIKYGFGNRITDDLSYIAAGVDRFCIFRIDSKSRVLTKGVEHHLQGYKAVEEYVGKFFQNKS
ncbi:nuclear elongation and deformation protein [Acrasis kona]|uniref:Nuclear elongation and deformation protein n=1 Tax=Acrasis kona TaxID=1008807 RepID=A0AAW2YNM4_9EUKA